MKNKILKLPLIAMAFVLAVSLFVSCKDDEPVVCGEEEKEEQVTNSDLLTVSPWLFQKVVTPDPNITADYTDYLRGGSITFNTNGSSQFNFGDTIENKTWEFLANETQILLDKGLDQMQIIDIDSLTTTLLEISFEDQGIDIEMTFSH